MDEGVFLSDDAVFACADLARRAGAKGFEIGFLHDNVPEEQAGWYANANYRGARITVEDRRSATDAVLALAEQLLRGAACRCGRSVTLSDVVEGCRWRLRGRRWEPGCDVEPMTVPGGRRGDVAALRQVVQQSGNRAERRKQQRDHGPDQGGAGSRVEGRR